MIFEVLMLFPHLFRVYLAMLLSIPKHVVALNSHASTLGNCSPNCQDAMCGAFVLPGSNTNQSSCRTSLPGTRTP